MISKFDAFYGGHVEIDNYGFQGIPVDDRWLSDEHLSSAFDVAKQFATVMDKKGFDTLWLSEHHFQREGYGCIPNIPMLSIYLSRFTQDLHFGGFFNVVPAWHPIRLAEDFAMADILTDGRVRLGVGRGYISREVETLGGYLEDNNANRELFEEQIEILRKAWDEPSFSHKGKHYQIPAEVSHRGTALKDITVVPRPMHGEVEMWQPITSATQRGYDFMVKNSINGVIATIGETADKFAAEYQAALLRVGKESELGSGLAIGCQIHIAETKEKALKEAEPFYEELLKGLAPLGRFPNLSEEQVKSTFDPQLAPLSGLPTIQDAVAEGSWICGPPEHVIEKLQELQDRFPGLDRVFIAAGGLGIPPSAMLADIEAFADDVMPAFATTQA